MKKTISYLLFILATFLSTSNLANCVVSGVVCPPMIKNTINDATLVMQIKSKIVNEPLLKDLNIEVSSDYGKVTLSGFVDTKQQFEKIVFLTHSLKEVKGIDTNNLKLKTSKIPITDAYITAKVKSTLIKDNLLDITNPKAIKIKTINHVVYLSGYVRSKNRENKIITSVKSVSGVNKVKSSITIRPKNIRI